MKLKGADYQVILIDRNNYHQFQPLYYQVAMAGLEPSSISFPIRKSFQGKCNVLIRVAELVSVDADDKVVYTTQGDLNYDYLIVATGAVTNFFGNKKLEKACHTLKSVNDALHLRNDILSDFEKALQVTNYNTRQNYIDIVIVGGGPTGVELAGALIEMKKYILPKDYPELNYREVDIYLIQSGDSLLKGMDESLGNKAQKYLTDLGVKVLLNERVVDVSDNHVFMKSGKKIQAGKIIWAAGVKCKLIDGLEKEEYKGRGGRLLVNDFNQWKGNDSVYVLGDAALMETKDYPNGHPQVAQPAIQQAKNLAKNFRRESKGKGWKSFKYKDLGSLATIGRNKAVAEFKRFNVKGFPAWAIWLLVHLYALVGVRNRVVVLLNWIWNYMTYDQSLRIIIKPSRRSKEDEIYE